MSTTAALDGFSGFSDEVAGADDRPQGGSLIHGTLVKFTNGAEWVTGAGDPMSRAQELIVIDLLRLVQKWIDQKPVETIIVPPGEKFPDVKAMNEKAPKSEWREWQGKMFGPWQMQYLVYLLDAHTLDKLTYPTSTTGGGMCCRAIAEKVAWMRKYKGPKVSAVITLADTFMNTQWGGRQRPHFNVVRWIGFDGGADKALPEPKPVLEGGAAAQSEAPPWKEVAEPSLREELNDDLPDNLK
jgi:hypothetical protein